MRGGIPGGVSDEAHERGDERHPDEEGVDRTPAVSLAPVHTAALRDRYGVVMRQIRRRQP